MDVQYILTCVTVCIFKEAETLNAVYIIFIKQTQPMIDAHILVTLEGLYALAKWETCFPTFR